MTTPDSQTQLFTRLWVEAQPIITSYIFSATRHGADTEDLLQSVAVAALTDFDRYDPDRPFMGWVLGIAKNRILKHYRQKGRERHVFGSEALEVLARTHEQAAHDHTAYHEALDRCTKALSDEHRNLLKLRYHENLRMADIAGRVGSTERAVINSMHRIRQRLAQCIQHRIESEGAGEVDHA